MSDVKVPPRLTDAELFECVKESGFPFELQIGRKLSSLGFEVELSQRFFDRTKKRDAEIDIIAKERQVHRTDGGVIVNHSLRLAVECKDSSQPLVFFGLPQVNTPLPSDKMDPDWPYCWVDTSRDNGLPNKLAAIAFDESRSALFRKRFHCQFKGPVRFSTVTTVEWQNKRPKLHVTDGLQSTISKFGAFVDDSRTIWSNLTRSPGDLERMMGGTPTVELTFLLLVHAGEQYQYSIDPPALKLTTRTSVFTRAHSERGVQFFVIDFVRADALDEAVTAIRNTYGLMVEHVLPTFLASRAANSR